jgi:hypothetical protein
MPSLIEIGQLLLESIFTLLLLFPLGEGQSPSFQEFRIPFPQG